MKLRYNNDKILLEVDGGVSLQNSKTLSKLGVDIFVIGNAIFKSEDKSKTINK